MFVTFLLGFVAAWRHDFGLKEAPILNRMVLLYAVPLALFAGTVTASRAELSQDIPLVIALCVAIIGLYGLVFLLSRIVFHLQMGTSAIPIAIASLVINLTVVPVTILLLALNATGGDSQGKSLAAQDGEHSASLPASHLSVLAAKLAETVKEPIVWAPVLGFVIVLSGLRIPQLIVHSLYMLGHASGGVALFACGIVLASGTIKVNRYVLLFVFLKNIVQPAMVFGGLRWLGYGNPVVSEAVLTSVAAGSRCYGIPPPGLGRGGCASEQPAAKHGRGALPGVRPR
jgi:predicted permease